MDMFISLLPILTALTALTHARLWLGPLAGMHDIMRINNSLTTLLQVEQQLLNQLPLVQAKMVLLLVQTLLYQEESEQQEQRV